MKTFEVMLKELMDSTGIRRIKYPLNDREIAFKYFVKMANAMLKWKEMQYDYKPVQDVIYSLIDWAYLLPNDNIDYNKGILLKGSTGRGKTFLLKVFAEFLKIDEMKFVCNGSMKHLSLDEVNARTLAFRYETEGYEVIQHYSNIPVLVINDIGAENVESVNFGNRVNIIDRLLDMREEKNLLTFGTTNLEKLSANYDARTISRMNSLFNVITVNHKTDFRKNG
jgi:DNA replication protein DnaC